MAEKAIISGANRFPDGVKKLPERLEKPLIYDWIPHAEFDIMWEATNIGLSLKGSTMYLPWFPCDRCAWLISGSGIERLISHKQMLELGNGDQYGFEVAYQMLKEAGIKMLMYDGKIGGVKHLFRGKVWEP